MIAIVLLIITVSLVAAALTFAIIPLVLAAVTKWRSKVDKQSLSSLYVGRVWHTRQAPKRHAFNYPLFIFSLDLEEAEHLLSSSPKAHLWPLTLVVNFRAADHLINGEGQNDMNCSEALVQRIMNLVSQKTKGTVQPTRESHRVNLVTHLSYYGYCFNPVSFYYVTERADPDKLTAIVGEVSNTPWNEMYCYVLHADSEDQVQVTERKKAVNFVFPKKFHVSPFMEMDYSYDWTFHKFVDESDPIRITTSMKRGSTLHFTATMEVFRKGLDPFVLVTQLIQFPIYCFIIQLWIHYEAFWLFLKGIAYVPHPEDSETTASRIIGNMMVPFFAFKDWLDQRTTESKAKES